MSLRPHGYHTSGGGQKQFFITAPVGSHGVAAAVFPIRGDQQWGACIGVVGLGCYGVDGRGPRILAVTRGLAWQRGQKWLLRPAITMRRIMWPQRRQGSPVC